MFSIHESAFTRRRLYRGSKDVIKLEIITTMKAIAVTPGTPKSAHLVEIPKPAVADIAMAAHAADGK